MSDLASISSAPPKEVSLDYSALRERGMDLIRSLAAQSWTDHNVHDPGITLLEASSYAMTEQGLRLQLDVADLVRSGEAHARADFVPAHRVLPVGPVTLKDLRTVLLDHPLVSDAQVSVQAGGLYEVLVELSSPDLNGNTYSLPVISGGTTFHIDLALPFWDDPEAVPFVQGATINTIGMIVDGGEVWRALPEPQSYFGRMNVGFTDTSGNPGTVIVWVLLQITDELATPAAVLPGILAAARTAVESTAAGDTLALFVTRVRSAAAAVDQLRRYLATWRGLCQQAVRIGVARVQEIAVRARIEVTGGIDVERLFAGIFLDIEQQLLSPRVRFASLEERRLSTADSERIYDGPLLRRGFIDPESLSAAPPDVLYTSDVLRVIMRHRSGTGTDLVTQENPVGRDIVAVTDLALANYINNRPITTDAENCLHLVEVQRYRPRLSVPKSRVVAVRNDSEVSLNLGRLQSLFTTMQTDAAAGAFTADPSSTWPVARGDLLPVEEYTPLQRDLPSLYGVGDAALPDSASTERRAAVRQLQGYLLLFEQFLGNLTSQLGNINRFFSADAAEETTYFVRPPFDLPGAMQLLKRFAPPQTWPAFVADPDNPMLRALSEAAENRERRLDRRNRMLDHLLARQGEDAVAFGQELHRWARAELKVESLPAAQQDASLARRREAANARLVRSKAALLRDAPELNAFRLLANSNPFFRDPDLLQIEGDGVTWRWHLRLNGQEQLRAFAPLTSRAAATFAAERAFLLARRTTLYSVVDTGGGVRRLNLSDGTTAPVQVLAESAQSWHNPDDAATALTAMAAAFEAYSLESSLAPLERRVAHLTGIRSQSRRKLLTPVSTLFEIFDEPAPPGFVGKRWRLWERPGQAGQVMLNSAIRFDETTDPAALLRARESIRQVLRYGMDEWNYEVVTTPAITFQLKDPAGNLLATHDAPFLTADAAQSALTATVDHLYRNYSAEGFYLIEHVLLRPMQAGDASLALPDGEGGTETDPYSHRMSFVFPSGYERDFSLPAETALRTPTTPDRFADPEFRRHAERTIQQSSPAHLMPTIYWVDRQLSGTPASAASFDSFEQRYFDWLDAVLIPDAPAATVTATRAALVESLNAVASDAA